MRILYAEDNFHVGKSVLRAMAKVGHEVVWVENGAELLAKLDNPGDYDVVVTDNSMPAMTGLEALKKIRADPRFEKLPVIVYSGDSLALAVKELGGEYVAKIKTEDLLDALGRIASALDQDRSL